MRDTERASVQHRDLPAHVTVYYVIAMAFTCGHHTVRFYGASQKVYNGSLVRT
ncbi:MAG: transposase domain-containing protein [Proteobacteria bacterium]|nr:transposase domain-containing protein [Pseudomonadota bacterium]